MNGRDLAIFERILRYADETATVLQEYDDDKDAVKLSSTARNAISMCVLQIGELVGHLHYEVIEQYPQIPWSRIRAMRNIAAHNYESFDAEILWQTAAVSIPELKRFCEGVLKEEASQ